jgi:hypothetical protein
MPQFISADEKSGKSGLSGQIVLEMRGFETPDPYNANGALYQTDSLLN